MVKNKGGRPRVEDPRTTICTTVTQTEADKIKAYAVLKETRISDLLRQYSADELLRLVSSET